MAPRRRSPRDLALRPRRPRACSRSAGAAAREDRGAALRRVRARPRRGARLRARGRASRPRSRATSRDDPRVVVPRGLACHSTRRVLTMSYAPAVPIVDRAGAAPPRRRRRREVLEILARAYARQVFVDGLFHADPHPGNLFVLDEPGAAAQPRVLFVDFGLSRRLDPALRREMRLGDLRRCSSGDQATPSSAGMQRMGDDRAGRARPACARAVAAMFERLRGRGRGAARARRRPRARAEGRGEGAARRRRRGSSSRTTCCSTRRRSRTSSRSARSSRPRWT